MSALDTPELVLAGGTNLRRPLEQGVPFVIGRAPDAGLKLPHPSVAPHHCQVLWQDDQLILTNLEGGDSTSINGVPLVRDASVHLQDGDEVQTGVLKLNVVWKAAAAPATVSVPAPGPAPSPAAQQGKRVSQPDTETAVRDGMTIGRAEDCDLCLDGSRVSRLQANVESTDDGFVLVDRGRAGSLANGLPFDRHSLVIGDCVQFGTHYFRYTGYSLLHVRNAAGCSIEGRGIAVEKRGGRGRILEGVDFIARSGQFVGILGPSGAGKTTLLRALCGFQALAEGEVLLNGNPRDEIPELSGLVGYVPQSDIVHLELTARQALQFSARLRLPSRTPPDEIDRLVVSLAERLKIAEHLDTPAGNMSGGQLKRVNVGVELLNRPALLFLDEPTSGLDPASELELMKLLQELTYTGCTVVCTTHLMENVYLMDSIEVIMAHRDRKSGKAFPGKSIFRGRSKLAKEFFDIQTLTQLYNRLDERTPDQWRAAFEQFQQDQNDSRTEMEKRPAVREPLPTVRKSRTRWSPPILLQRQWAVLQSDWKNLLLLTTQPILIALLISLVAVDTYATGPKLFLAYIAILWFGCSNAAQELVKEREIFRREQFVGLGTHAYLVSKLFGMAVITCFQSVLLYGLLKVLGQGLSGSMPWQGAGLFAAAICATGIGLAISAWSKTRTQAVTLVPLFLIPQILFSGFLFPLNDWNHAPVPRILSRCMPSFGCQRIMDTSQLWGLEITGYYDTGGADEESLQARGLHFPYDNLSVSLLPWKTFLTSSPFEFRIDESTHFLKRIPSPDLAATYQWPEGEAPAYRAGYIFGHAIPGLSGFLSLGIWTVLCYGFAYFLTVKRSD